MNDTAVDISNTTMKHFIASSITNSVCILMNNGHCKYEESDAKETVKRIYNEFLKEDSNNENLDADMFSYS